MFLKIFEPFVQADLSTTKNYGGTGLGMTIVKKYIDAYGPQYNLESFNKPTMELLDAKKMPETRQMLVRFLPEWFAIKIYNFIIK